ncbi:MAG: CopD family protein [Gemmatimonadaceae bacterium]
MRFGAGRLSAIVWAVAIALPGAALAHGLLRSSSPAAQSVLTSPPRVIRLTFTEAPELTFTRIRLAGPAGDILLGPLEILPGMVAAAKIPGVLEPGVYRVEWRTAGADGHPVSGQFPFTVKLAIDSNAAGGDTMSPPAQSHAEMVGHTATSGDERGGVAKDFLAVILRWFTLAGAIVAIGAVAFRLTVLARVSLEIDREIKTDYLPAAARGAAIVGLVASATVAVVAIARLLLQSRAMHGGNEMWDPALIAPMLTDTNWGRAWLLQMAAAITAVASYAAIHRSRQAAWYVAGAATVALVVGLALASHAASVPRLVAQSIVANSIHTVAASGWLGNLLVVFLVGLPLAWRLDRDDRWTVVRDVVNAFSPAALGFGGLAGATGVFMAWTHVGSLAALTGTDYGRVLLLKVGLLSLTALTGAYNWLRVRPTLGDQTGALRLRRTAGVEIGIAALVVAVTAVLVALPMPMD